MFDLRDHASSLVPGKTLVKIRAGAKALYRGPYNGTSRYAYDWVLLEEGGGEECGYCFHTTLEGKYEPEGAEYDCDIVAIHKKWEPRDGDLVRVYGAMGVYNNGAETIDWQNGSTLFQIRDVIARGTSNHHVKVVPVGMVIPQEYFTHVRNLKRERP